MTTFTETTHPGGFLVWEAFRDYRRPKSPIASTQGVIDSCWRRLAPAMSAAATAERGKSTGQFYAPQSIQIDSSATSSPRPELLRLIRINVRSQMLGTK